MDDRKIGFVGLGIMGKPMAKNLLKAGYRLTVYDVNKQAVDEVVEAGAVAASSYCEVAAASDVVITMLPNSSHVKAAVLGVGGVLEGMRSYSVLIDMSSIAPQTSREIAAAVRARGAEMLDAPVSGGEPKAVNGMLAIMVGGSHMVFEQIKGILLKMGSSAVYVGDIGSGNVTKLANQMIVAINIAAMSEALVLAAKAGVDPEKVFQAIRGGLAGSAVLEAKAPMALDGNFKPGFRIELHIKDLINAIDTAEETGSPAPLTGMVLKMMQALGGEGHLQDDHSGLIRYYEKLADAEVRRHIE